MALTIAAIVAFGAHVALWISLPARREDPAATPTGVIDLVLESQAS